MSDAKTLILGGGLAGVSAAYHSPRGSFQLIEREEEVGGTARSFKIGGFTFDFTGHLLHLHNPYTKKLIPRLLSNDFFTCRRDAWIFSHDAYTRYPFQAFTYGLPAPVVRECVLGFLEASEKAVPPEKRSRNFKEWCLQVFGRGISKHFMIPYNEKLYQTPAGRLTTDWCGPFVPLPDLSEVVAGALQPREQAFGYNTTFLYPRRGGIQALPAAMARGLRGLRTGESVRSIDWKRRVATLDSGETVSYRRLINTIPMAELLKRMIDLPPAVARAARSLRFASILCVNIGVGRSRISDRSWIYFPEPQFPFYRVGFPMNFTPHVVPKGCSSMYVEVPMKRAAAAGGEKALLSQIRRGLESARILRKGDDLPVVQFLPIKYAYVIYDQNRSSALRVINAFLSANGAQSIGRYGAWKYSFMEEAILDGRAAAEKAAS